MTETLPSCSFLMWLLVGFSENKDIQFGNVVNKRTWLFLCGVKMDWCSIWCKVDHILLYMPNVS